MPALTVTVRGQVTFRKHILKHLGIKPGDKIEINLLPDGKATLKACQQSGSIDAFIGLLASRTQKIVTIDEMNDAAAQGWAHSQ